MAFIHLVAAFPAHVDTDAHHILLSLRFHMIPLPQTSPLLRGQFNARRIDSALVHPNLFKRHSRRTLYLACIMKGYPGLIIHGACA